MKLDDARLSENLTARKPKNCCGFSFRFWNNDNSIQITQESFFSSCHILKLFSDTKRAENFS